MNFHPSHYWPWAKSSLAVTATPESPPEAAAPSRWRWSWGQLGTSQQATQREEGVEHTPERAVQLRGGVEERFMRAPVIEEAYKYPNIKLDHYDKWEPQDKRDLHEMIVLGVQAKFKTPQEVHGLKHANKVMQKQRRKDRRKAHQLTIAAARERTPPPSSPPQLPPAPAPKRRLSSAEPSRRTRVSAPLPPTHRTRVAGPVPEDDTALFARTHNLTAVEGVPVPIRSGIVRDAVPSSAKDGMAQLACDVMWERLVQKPQDLAVMAPSGNWPTTEVGYNTVTKLMFSRRAPEAASAPQGQSRICDGCWNGVCQRGACCTNGEGCTACDSCCGQRFICSICFEEFELRWVYESGSGLYSVARDPARFEVRSFPVEMEACARHLDITCTSCVLVGYLGSAYCMHCLFGLNHGAKKCGSILHDHTDRCMQKCMNSQDDSANRTLNIGDTRTLTMSAYLKHPRVNKYEHDPRGQSKDVPMHAGTVFELEPNDEEILPRDATGVNTPVLGYFKHGMTDELQGNLVSCGAVFRPVTRARQVNVRTNRVILTPDEKNNYETALLPEGFLNTPCHYRHAKKGPRGLAFRLVREEWADRAPAYAAHVRPLLECAFRRWGKAPRQLE